MVQEFVSCIVSPFPLSCWFVVEFEHKHGAIGDLLERDTRGFYAVQPKPYARALGLNLSFLPKATL